MSHTDDEIRRTQEEIVAKMSRGETFAFSSANVFDATTGEMIVEAGRYLSPGEIERVFETTPPMVNGFVLHLEESRFGQDRRVR
jgi:hypothetical protein